MVRVRTDHQKMPPKLWIQHKTTEKTFICKVSTEGCQDIDDFLEKIRKTPQLAIHPASHLTLFKSDGTTEADVGDSPSLLFAGNSGSNPLVVTDTLTASSIIAAETAKFPSVNAAETAKFELYAWKASKKPFEVILLSLDKGQIPLAALLRATNFLRLYRIDVDGDVLLVALVAGKDGFSTHRWANGQTFKLRVAASICVDTELSFSELDNEKMNILLVRDDFGIKFDEKVWLFSGDSVQFPVALTETLALFAQFNSLRVQPSRRSIVSLLLHSAISAVPEGETKLCIDEGTPLAIVRNINRYGDKMNVRYFGTVGAFQKFIRYARRCSCYGDKYEKFGCILSCFATSGGPGCCTLIFSAGDETAQRFGWQRWTHSIYSYRRRTLDIQQDDL